MYTDGMLCALFFFHAYPTVHEKICSMPKIVGVAHGDNDRCCRNLEGPVYNKKIADEISCDSACTEKANCGKSDTPKLYAPALQ